MIIKLILRSSYKNKTSTAINWINNLTCFNFHKHLREFEADGVKRSSLNFRAVITWTASEMGPPAKKHKGS